jgi:hypothetical protein
MGAEHTQPHQAYAEAIELLNNNGFEVHACDFNWDVDQSPSPSPFSFEFSAMVTYTGED